MPDLDRVQLLLAYRATFDPSKNISHVGLGNACLQIGKVLQANGVSVIVKGLNKETDINLILENNSFTHVVVAAPWMTNTQIGYMCSTYPSTTFAVNCHSNIGFLQSEPAAIGLIRSQMEMEAGLLNFHMAGNSTRYCEAMLRAYLAPMTWLPNLYYNDNTSGLVRPGWATRGGTLRIGMFGCPRTQKRFLDGALAAVIMSQDLKVNTTLYVNGGRNDGGEQARLWAGIAAETANIPNFQVVTYPWAPWPQFRTQVESMDICFQPSDSESFNLVVADAASRGIPSVTTAAIDWVPPEWKATTDDVNDLARTGISLLYDPQAGQRGYQALQAYVENATTAWLDYLVNNEFGVAARPWHASGQTPQTRKNPRYTISYQRAA